MSQVLNIQPIQEKQITTFNYDLVKLYNSFENHSSGIYQDKDSKEVFLKVGVDLAEKISQVCFVDLNTDKLMNFAVETKDLYNFFDKLNCNVRVVIESCSNSLDFNRTIEDLYRQKPELTHKVEIVSHTLLNKFHKKQKSDVKDALFLYDCANMGYNLLNVVKRNEFNRTSKDLIHRLETMKTEYTKMLQSFIARVKTHHYPAFNSHCLKEYESDMDTHAKSVLQVLDNDVKRKESNIKKSKSKVSIYKHTKLAAEAKNKYTIHYFAYQDLKRHYSDLLHKKKLINSLTKDINDIVSISAEATIVNSIPGISPSVALAIVSAIDDINNFSSPQKLLSYLGFAPKSKGSGGKIIQYGLIDCSNHFVRKGFYRSIFAFVSSIKKMIKGLNKKYDTSYVENYMHNIKSSWLLNIDSVPNKKATFKLIRKCVYIIYKLLKLRSLYDSNVGQIGNKYSQLVVCNSSKELNNNVTQNIDTIYGTSINRFIKDGGKNTYDPTLGPNFIRI